MKFLKGVQPLIVAIIFALIAAGSTWWLWQSVEASGIELKERIQTIENQRVFDTQLKELASVVEGTAAEREQLYEFILKDENDTIRLLSELDAIALRQQVSLSTRELLVVEQSGEFNDLRLGLELMGREAAIDQMIEMFESLPYRGTVTTLSYERTRSEETGNTEVRASITLLLTIEKYDQ